MNTTTTATASTGRKLLLPLATLAVAGAVAVGSGATWTDESSIDTSVTGGTLVHVNDKDGMSLVVTNLKPGASETGTLNIDNTGSLNSTLSIMETGATNNFEANKLQLKIVIDGTTVFDNEFGAMVDDQAYGSIALPEGDDVDVEITVRLTGDSDNDDQGKTANADFTFVTTQTDASTDDETDSIWN